MADDKPIIVVKKKGGHGGHHGGAWKIAYADFVTAMMAFFMVMWLVNSATVTTKQSIASYFRKPGIFTEGSGTPLLLGGAGILDDAFIPPRPEDKRLKTKVITQELKKRLSGETDKDLDKSYIQEGNKEPQKGKGPTESTGLNSDKTRLDNKKKEIKIYEIAKAAEASLRQLMNQMPEMRALLGQLDMKVEADGLKIEIMDTDKASMFDSGSPRIKREAEPAFARVTDILKRYPNKLEISGHTDGKPFPSRTGAYTNWELSADRANAARRLIESQGFPGAQITSVVGKAATDPKVPEDPLAPSNRRITLKMKITPDEPLSDPSKKDLLKPLANLLVPPAPTGPMPAWTPGAPLPTPTPSPTPTETPDVPQPTPTKLAAAEPKDRIKLPEGTPLTKNPDYMPEDKIFNNSPVLGPSQMFSGH